MTPSDVIELAGVSRPDRVRVVHLSSGHRAGESRIFRKECRSLARAGYDVTYVCRGDPHFTPDGADMVQDGVRILTVKRRAGRLGRMVVTPLEIVMVGLRQGGTLYHFHDPELIPLGLILRLLGKRVIYDVHEDVPRDVLVKEWIPRILRQPVSLAMALVEWIAARTLSGLVAATPAIARRFPKDSVALVQNFAFTSELDGRALIIAVFWIAMVSAACWPSHGSDWCSSAQCSATLKPSRPNCSNTWRQAWR